MNVTMSMVLEGLRRHFECEKGGGFNPGKRVGQARFVDGSHPARTSGDLCFVASRPNWNLLADAPYEAVIVGFLPGEPLSPCAIRVLGTHDAAAIRDAVQDVISAYETWGSDLMDLALHGAGLEELVDFAHGMFNNPVTILDESYRVWAQTDDDAMDDELWVRSAHGADPSDIRQGQGAEPDERGFDAYFARLRERGLLVGYTTSLGTKMAACAAEGASGTILGVNVVEKNRPITGADIECLKYLASIVSLKMKAMEFSWRDSSGSYFGLLQDVVRGNLSDNSEFKARLSKTWISLDRYFTVFVFTGRTGFLKYHQLCRVEDDLACLLPTGTCVISSRSLVMFVNHGDVLGQEVVGSLREYAEECDLAVGMSESRTDECSLRTLLDQAHLALRVRRRVFPDEHLAAFDDCKRYYLYDLCSQQPDWRLYAHECLAILEGRDVDGAPSLLVTLRCLVKNHGSRSATSEQLGIQRNTLQYRLQRIEETCGIDLGDPDTFDHIAFSIGLADYCSL